MKKLLVLLVVLVAATVTSISLATPGVRHAASHKPPHTTAGPASLSATYDAGTQHLSIAGCGYDILTPGGVQVVYTHPDTTTETWYIGIWNDDIHGQGCLDSNYILASASGTWTIDTFQSGVQIAETTITLP